MSLHGDYDPQNIFAQIIRGEAPCYKLYEDDDVLAFLDLFQGITTLFAQEPKIAIGRVVLMLLGFLLVMNGIAIFLRQRLERKW